MARIDCPPSPECAPYHIYSHVDVAPASTLSRLRSKSVSSRPTRAAQARHDITR